MIMARNMYANNIVDEQIQSELYNALFRTIRCFIPNKRLILFRTKHIILSKSLFGGALMAGIMTVKEAAKRWDVSERRIGFLCQEGRIPGAHKEGRRWLIPDDAEKPVDQRRKNQRPVAIVKAGAG